MTPLDAIVLARADEQMKATRLDGRDYPTQACIGDGCRARVVSWNKTRLCAEHAKATYYQRQRERLGRRGA